MPIRKGTFEFQISDYRADQAWILFFMSVIKHLQRKQVYLLSWQHSWRMSHALIMLGLIKYWVNLQTTSHIYFTVIRIHLKANGLHKRLNIESK